MLEMLVMGAEAEIQNRKIIHENAICAHPNQIGFPN